MKWLVLIRLIIIFAPLIQKLFSDASPTIKNQALRAGIDKAEKLFPNFKKVSKNMETKDLKGIINLFEWFANVGKIRSDEKISQGTQKIWSGEGDPRGIPGKNSEEQHLVADPLDGNFIIDDKRYSIANESTFHKNER